MVFGVGQLNYASRIWLMPTLVAMAMKIFGDRGLMKCRNQIIKFNHVNNCINLFNCDEYYLTVPVHSYLNPDVNHNL